MVIFLFRLLLQEELRIKMSHGIVSALRAPIAQLHQLVNVLPVVTIIHTVLIASGSCLLRDVGKHLPQILKRQQLMIKFFSHSQVHHVQNPSQVSKKNIRKLEVYKVIKLITTNALFFLPGIGGTRFISFEDRHWHNDCFICASCKTSLVGRGFITDEADIICPECAKAKLM